MNNLKWQRVGRTLNENGTTIVYEAAGCKYAVESRKRHIPHASGSGTWDHTTYVVMYMGYDVKTFFHLADAKEWAEKHDNVASSEYAAMRGGE